jgi:uncharacterized protein YdaU (DUF1376 family)
MGKTEPKMVAMHFFVADWISGTRDLSCQQRGIYIDLLAFSQSKNGKGLNSNLDDLCRLVLPYEPNQDKAEQLRADLIYVINSKFKNIEGRFFNIRQHQEFIKSKELSEARSLARSKVKTKKVDAVLLQQPDDFSYKGKDKHYINSFNTMWSNISAKIRIRSSKPKSLERFNKLSDEDKEKVIKTYPIYHEQQGEFTKSLESWILNQMFNEIDMPLTKDQQDDADKKIRKSRYELAVKQGGPLYSMSITEYNKLKEEFGQEEEEK